MKYKRPWFDPHDSQKVLSRLKEEHSSVKSLPICFFGRNVNASQRYRVEEVMIEHHCNQGGTASFRPWLQGCFFYSEMKERG
jgi:hypothetical protein